MTQIETSVRLYERLDQNDGVWQGFQIHVSEQVLVFVTGSYYNVPWSVSPCVYSVLWSVVFLGVDVVHAAIYDEGVR